MFRKAIRVQSRFHDRTAGVRDEPGRSGVLVANLHLNAGFPGICGCFRWIWHGSRGDSHGFRVEVDTRGMDFASQVRFCGETEFAGGIWVGIQLDEAVGRHRAGSFQLSLAKCELLVGS